MSVPVRRLRAAVVAVVVAVAPALVAQSSAHAAGSLGACYVHRSGYTFYGWCDGTGPDYTYAAFASCKVTGQSSIITTTWGVTRWAGDRRQSYAACDSSRTPWIHDGGITVAYKGKWVKTVRP